MMRSTGLNHGNNPAIVLNACEVNTQTALCEFFSI